MTDDTTDETDELNGTDGPASDASPRRRRLLGDRVTRHLAGRRYALVAAAAVTLVAVDQLTKSWAVDRLSNGDIDLVGSLRLRLAFNSGAAFSIGSDSGLGPLIAALALVVVAVLLFSGSLARTRTGAVAIGLVAGGAMGNIVDRAFRQGGPGLLGGYVVDFIDLQWWPAFNLADAAICVGAVGLVLLGLFAPEPAAGDR